MEVSISMIDEDVATAALERISTLFATSCIEVLIPSIEVEIFSIDCDCCCAPLLTLFEQVLIRLDAVTTSFDASCMLFNISLRLLVIFIKAFPKLPTSSFEFRECLYEDDEQS